uniref:Putative encoded protein n=1 Tax=Dunaliella salina TaxID=3046 RepID=A0A1C8XRK3_DUNSA|nr:putative encoded protein [Dunaliella salina]
MAKKQEVKEEVKVDAKDSTAVDAGNDQSESRDVAADMVNALSGPPFRAGITIYGGPFPVDNIKAGEYTKEISDTDLTNIVEHVHTGYGISYRTALNAVCEMIRRDGAAKGTPPSFSVEVFCPEEQTLAIIVQRDVARAVELICRGKRNFRNLAQKLPPLIVRTGLKRYMVNPELDMSGDLANKINNRLLMRKEEPLSVFERIGCASYDQSIPDLDKLCASTRLAHLLAEDLELRSSANKGSSSQKQGKGQQQNKGKQQSKNQQKGKGNNSGKNKKISNKT